MLIVFIASSVTLLAIWVLYPAWMYLVSRSWRPSYATLADDAPTIDVIIATRDSPSVIRDRVANILESQYPREKMTIIVALDAAIASDREAFREALGDTAIVLVGDGPGGKAGALNAAVRSASSDILVFADSRQRFEPSGIPRLIEFIVHGPFEAASGLVVQTSGDTVIDYYWQYEIMIRRGQSAVQSIVAATGQMYGVWRELWRPVPAGALCDDLYETMDLAMRGVRLGLCEAARVIDSRRFSRNQHYQRKVRTLTGVIQTCMWMPGTLLPWQNPVWLHFVMHKLLRMLTPYLALAMAGSAILLVYDDAPRMSSTALIVVGGAAVAIALLFPRVISRATDTIFWMALLLGAPMIALLNALRGDWQVWQHHQPVGDS